MFAKSITFCCLILSLTVIVTAQNQAQPLRRLSLSKMLPGTVYVSQRIDIARQFGQADNIATIDGEPLPLKPSTNITLGVVIDDQGYVVTRLSGVSPENPPQEVVVYNSSSQQFPASFIGMDTVTGLCILKVEKGSFKAPELAASAALPVRGMATLYGFNPRLKPGPNVMMLRPRIESPACRLVRAEGDFRYNPGTPVYYLTRPELTQVQDGSIVVTGNDRIFGIAVYDASGEGKHLVYPITRVINLAQTIIKANDSIANGWLGATGVDLSMAPIKTHGAKVRTPTPVFEPGVRIDGVIPDSPAEVAGMQISDILLRVSGRRITSLGQLGDTLRQLPADSEITLQVKRGSEYKMLQAKLMLAPGPTPARQIRALRDKLTQMEEKLRAIPPADPFRKEYEGKVGVMRSIVDRLFGTAPSDVRLRVLYGFEVEAEPLTAQLKEYFATPGNLLVVTVNPGSRAARAGLNAGDVIVKISGKEIKDQDALVRALDETAGSGGQVEILVTRQHEQVKLILPH
ncbi:MAG: PDZ domain-containing protein [Blastocatellia bacterium]